MQLYVFSGANRSAAALERDQWCSVLHDAKNELAPGTAWEVSRVRRRLIREYSPGIGFPHPFVVVILYHIQRLESERFVKIA